ncbi:hypothetical protein ABZX77_48725 [Streptomyces sp. NPDC004237]|uniref:hypothetical protein n=1 Tax=Streptomyces sp. NPDC004237 TaxID=3154455 RepID=UPI0033AF31DF
MTTPAPRFPTPADVAAGRIPARPAGPVLRRFDRHAWEEALLDSVLPHHTANLLGWALAHLAPSSGEFRAGTAKDAGHLARATRLTGRQIRMGLKALEGAGLLVRARGEVIGQEHALARGFTLTLPSAAARTEPAHTGEPA